MIREKIKAEAKKQRLNAKKLWKLTDMPRYQSVSDYIAGRKDLEGKNIEKLFKALNLILTKKIEIMNEDEKKEVEQIEEVIFNPEIEHTEEEFTKLFEERDKLIEKNND